MRNAARGAHRRSDTNLSNNDVAACDFPPHAALSGVFDALHDRVPKSFAIKGLRVMRRRIRYPVEPRVARLLARCDKCRCRICASDCRNSSATSSFF